MSEWIPLTVGTVAFLITISFIAGNGCMYIIMTELKPWSNKIREKYGYLWR